MAAGNNGNKESQRLAAGIWRRLAAGIWQRFERLAAGSWRRFQRLAAEFLRRRHVSWQTAGSWQRIQVIIFYKKRKLCFFQFFKVKPFFIFV
jgi:hypothetical protein